MVNHEVTVFWKKLSLPVSAVSQKEIGPNDLHLDHGGRDDDHRQTTLAPGRQKRRRPSADAEARPTAGLRRQQGHARRRRSIRRRRSVVQQAGAQRSRNQRQPVRPEARRRRRRPTPFPRSAGKSGRKEALAHQQVQHHG